MLAGCMARPEPRRPAVAGLPPTQMPYHINGIWYYPIPSAQGYAEEGIASWYGPDFHGRLTSNGERYDMYAMTAAHKTLPLGTLVKVTRTDNGKSIVVRVNDRGPFVAGRIIDLTHSAAAELDMIRAGTAPVRVEAIRRATEEKHDGTSSWSAEPIPDFRSGTFIIPVGTFTTKAAADAMQKRLRVEGEQPLVQQAATDTGVQYRVCAGTYRDLIEAHITAAQLRENGFTEAYVLALDKPARQQPK